MDEPTAQPRVVATIEQYDDLAAALRRWVLDELRSTFAAVDDVSGLPDRYCAKLLAAEPIKGIGLRSLPLLLSATGLKLQLVVDEDQLAKVRPRLRSPASCAPFIQQPGPRSETLQRRHWRKRAAA